MKKRVVFSILAAAMLLTTLSACGDQSREAQETENKSASKAEKNSTSQEEVEAAPVLEEVTATESEEKTAPEAAEPPIQSSCPKLRNSQTPGVQL